MSVVILLTLIDQFIKVYIKTHFTLHECYEVTSWFKLLFIENNGMAFGLELGTKLFLTLFRIIATIFGIWYIAKLIRKGVSTGFLLTLSFILAGALGNIIDCMFYGLIFTNPVDVPAQLVSFGEGYGHFLQGRVVDMFYFPLVEWNWPDWMPLIGGEHFIFFSPIFNFADSCITCGVFVLLLFYRKYLISNDTLSADSVRATEKQDSIDEYNSHPND